MIVHYAFGIFPVYLAASAAKYCEKGVGRYKNGRGVVGKPILEVLTFLKTNLTFKESQDDGFGWRATASGLSPSNRGGCASSRLDHGLKV